MNKRKKTIGQKRVFLDYDYGFSGYGKHAFGEWAESIAEDLFDEGYFDP